MLMPEDSGTKLKRCGKCTKEKPASEFNKNSRAKDGLQTLCRVCASEANRRWYEENKEKHNERCLRWAAANKERKAKNDRRWREANKDKVAEKRRRWRDANKDIANAATRRWQEKNPKRAAYNKQKGHAKKRGIEFLLTFEEWCAFWGDDFCKRGTTKGKLVMARYGDTGPYAIGNIKKILHSENTSERHELRKSKDQTLHKVQRCG